MPWVVDGGSWVLEPADSAGNAGEPVIGDRCPVIGDSGNEARSTKAPWILEVMPGTGYPVTR